MALLLPCRIPVGSSRGLFFTARGRKEFTLSSVCADTRLLPLVLAVTKQFFPLHLVSLFSENYYDRISHGFPRGRERVASEREDWKKNGIRRPEYPMVKPRSVGF